MIPERIELTGTVTFHDPEGVRALFDSLTADAPRDDERALALSRLTGLDVLVDLSMFDLAWSPIYRASAGDQPVAWVHNTTGFQRPDNPYV